MNIEFKLYFVIIVLGIIIGLGIGSKLFSQSDVVFSPYTYGENWQERHNVFKAEIETILNKTHIDSADIWFFNAYKYVNVSDSAIYIYDLTQDSTLLLIRYLEPLDFKEVTPIETEWVHYVKSKNNIRGSILNNKKIDIKGMTFNGWGPNYKPRNLNEKDREYAKNVYELRKKEVDTKLKDGKDWYKNNKKLSEKEKRNTAWQILGKKVKESEVTKIKKGK